MKNIVSANPFWYDLKENAAKVQGWRNPAHAFKVEIYQPLDFNEEPNCVHQWSSVFQLLVEVDEAHNVKLNGKPFGTLRETTELKKHLLEIFQTADA